jgi:hypothetical protein
MQTATGGTATASIQKPAVATTGATGAPLVAGASVATVTLVKRGVVAGAAVLAGAAVVVEPLESSLEQAVAPTINVAAASSVPS